MSVAKRLTTAETAKLLRAELKRCFPKTVFSVRSKTYSGGSSISVGWEDGPTTRQVEAVTDRYKGADFDGMQDLKTYRGPQWMDGKRVEMGADYVFCSRSYSPDLVRHIAVLVEARYGVAVELRTDSDGGVHWHQDYAMVVGNRTARDLCWELAQETPWYGEATPAQPAALRGAPGYTVTVVVGENALLSFAHKPRFAVRQALKQRGYTWDSERTAWRAPSPVVTTEDLQAVDAALAGAESVALPAVAADGETPALPVASDFAPELARVDAYAVRLRRAADSAERQAGEKRNSGLYNQNPTRRRMAMLASIEQDALHLERVAAALRALADRRDAGTLPAQLAALTTRAMAERLITSSYYPSPELDKPLWTAFIRAGITPDVYPVVRGLLLPLAEAAPRETPVERQVRDAMRALVGVPIADYFPTPPAVIDRLLAEADIRDGMAVLEPSAGAGHIADAIRAAHPSARLVLIEADSRLVQVLRLKGYDPLHEDFLDEAVSAVYDRVVANPPFSDLQDVTHVRRMYDWLRPGGRLVSVMSASPFFREDRKAREFRAWLEDVGGWSEELPSGSFEKSERPTGVATRIVVIDKGA
jgi:phospholipid N-methyltransferase